MAGKKHRPEEALARLRQVDVLVSQGRSVADEGAQRGAGFGLGHSSSIPPSKVRTIPSKPSRISPTRG